MIIRFEKPKLKQCMPFKEYNIPFIGWNRNNQYKEYLSIINQMNLSKYKIFSLLKSRIFTEFKINIYGKSIVNRKKICNTLHKAQSNNYIFSMELEHTTRNKYSLINNNPLILTSLLKKTSLEEEYTLQNSQNIVKAMHIETFKNTINFSIAK